MFKNKFSQKNFNLKRLIMCICGVGEYLPFGYEYCWCMGNGNKVVKICCRYNPKLLIHSLTIQQLYNMLVSKVLFNINSQHKIIILYARQMTLWINFISKFQCKQKSIKDKLFSVELTTFNEN